MGSGGGAKPTEMNTPAGEEVGPKTETAINRKQKRIFPMIVPPRRGNEDCQNYDCIRANNRHR